MKMSKDLPAAFKNVESFSVKVEQAPDSMVVTPGMTGQGRTFSLPPFTYKFDGSEVYREDPARSSQRWSKAQWTSTGQKLIITSRVIQKQNVPEERYTQTDVWQFGKKNTLMVLSTQKYEDKDSSHTERRYYRRVE